MIELIGQRQHQPRQRLLVVRVDLEDVEVDALGLPRLIEQPVALRLGDGVGVDHRGHVVQEEGHVEDHDCHACLRIRDQPDDADLGADQKPEDGQDEEQHRQRPEHALAQVAGIDLAHAGEEEREQRGDCR